MKLKKLLALSLSAAMVLSLTACGSNGTADTSKETAATSQKETGSGEDVTLNFYAWSDEEGIFTTLANAYMEEHPNVTINMQFTPIDNYDAKLMTAFSGGGEIDCYALGTAPALAQHQARGTVMALNDLIASTGTDTSGYQATLDGIQMEGNTYALPYKTSSWVVFYNKDIFDAAGVDYPSEDWTWEDYYEIAGQLTSGEGNDKIYGSLNFQPTSMWWRIPANSKGATDPMVEEELDAWMDAAEYVKSLSDAGYQPLYEDMADEAGADYTGNFLQGKYAMFYNGDWEYEMLNTAIAEGNGEVNYDIAPLPHWKGEDAYTPGSPGLLMVAKNAENPDVAFDFISYCAGEKGAKILLESDYFPAWQSDETIAAYTSGVEVPEHIEYIVNQEIISQNPCNEYNQAAQNVIKEEVSLYLVGEQDIVQTKENIVRRIQNEVLVEE